MRTQKNDDTQKQLMKGREGEQRDVKGNGGNLLGNKTEMTGNERL